MKYITTFFLLMGSLTACKGTILADESSYKKLKYEVSLGYTQWHAGKQWWSKIEPFNIYLGALPLKNKDHLQQITALGVTHVLSMVENFELEDGWLNQPVKADDWVQNGISVEHISAVDFLPLTRDEIERGVESLAQKLEEGHTVYVHCKAGRGRSATIVIAYLMKHQMFTYDDAFALVKKQRPQINLNAAQRQAILDYFSELESEVDTQLESQNSEKSFSENINDYLQNQTLISEEKLAELLESILDPVIDGGSYSPAGQFPESFSAWIPALDVESTISRRNRYLREYQGDQNAATEASIQRNHSYTRKFKQMAAGFVPYVGAPASYSISLWHQMREIALIAAIHGHDLRDPVVKTKMLSCLMGGDLLKAPSAAVGFVARKIAKQILLKAGIEGVSSSLIPVHLIFNYFTDNSAMVSTHAKTLFAGENSLPIPAEEYFVRQPADQLDKEI